MGENLLRSTTIVGAMTVISRILGLVRDIVLARLLGASIGADTFIIAFKIPNFLRRLFAEGAFSQAFVPVLSEYKARRSHTEVSQLVSEVTGALGSLLLGVTLGGVLAAPVLVMIFAPGFVDEMDKFDLTVRLLWLTFPYVLFISLTALAAGILNTYGQFGIPALTPMLLNLSLLGAALLLAPYLEQPAVALAGGVLIGGVAQLLFQLPFLARLRLLPRPRLGWKSEGVHRVLKLMLPSVLGVSVTQINLLVDTVIASFLVTGSVSWLYYSDRLMEFPLGVFGIALGTVILPNLSRKYAQDSVKAFSQTLDWALRLVVLIGLPASLGLMLLASPLLATLFQYEQFEPQDVHMAARSLVAYSLGLVGFILVKVLAPAFYAQQDTRTPVRIAVVAMGVNLLLNLALVVPLAHAGLALATSVAAFINAGLLFITLHRRRAYGAYPGWARLGRQVLFANISMGIVLWWQIPATEQWLVWSVHERVAQLAILVGMGTTVYFIALWVCGLRFYQLRLMSGHPT